MQSWTPVGKMLVIRRGKMGEHVRVPDTGAIVEFTIKATPPLAEPLGPGCSASSGPATWRRSPTPDRVHIDLASRKRLEATTRT